LAIAAISTDSGDSDKDFITNDTTLTVRGSTQNLAAGQRVQISVDGGATWRDATVAADGQWSFQDPIVHTGNFTYQARVVDASTAVLVTASQAVVVDTHASGNSDGVFVTITGLSDNVAPVEGPVANGGFTNDTSPTLSGNLTGPLAAGEVIAIFRNDVRVGTATLAGGSWTFTDGGLADASYTYEARVVDVAGNQGAKSAAYAVTVDTQAPNATTETISNLTITDDTGESATDFITSDTSLTVSGTHSAASGSTIQVSTDGGATWVDATITGTTWSYVDPATHGTSFTYSVRVVDAAGNIGITYNQPITIDTTAPAAAETVAITAITTDTGSSASDFVTSDTSLTVSGTNAALTAGHKIQVSSDGGVTWADATVTGTTWTYTDPANHATSFSYQARVVDLAGNVGQTATQAVTIDTTAPTAAETVSIDAITNDSGTAGDFITNDATLIVSGSNAALVAGSKIQVSADGVTWTDVT
ncbi:MAG: type 1 secretion protein, partial [Comamonadaceae bacterium]